LSLHIELKPLHGWDLTISKVINYSWVISQLSIFALDLVSYIFLNIGSKREQQNTLFSNR